MEQAAHLDSGHDRPRAGTYTRVLLVRNVATAQRGLTSRAGDASAHSIPTIGGVLLLKRRQTPRHLGKEAPELTTRAETPVPQRSSE